MYQQAENPIFAPWTPDRGGGPPCLWEFGGHLYEHRWQDNNIGFLKQTLTPHAIGDVLRRAVNHLVDQPDYRVAAEIQSDLPLCAETLAARGAELPIVLERVREPGRAPEW
jgi:hypothetical protein